MNYIDPRKKEYIVYSSLKSIIIKIVKEEITFSILKQPEYSQKAIKNIQTLLKKRKIDISQRTLRKLIKLSNLLVFT